MKKLRIILTVITSIAVLGSCVEDEDILHGDSNYNENPISLTLQFDTWDLPTESSDARNACDGSSMINMNQKGEGYSTLLGAYSYLYTFCTENDNIVYFSNRSSNTCAFYTEKGMLFVDVSSGKRENELFSEPNEEFYGTFEISGGTNEFANARGDGILIITRLDNDAIQPIMQHLWEGVLLLPKEVN